MKRTKYLILGTMIMLLAGTVYTWTIIAKSISATYPAWSAQALSMTFTITMMGYALGGMASGIVVRRTGPKPVLAAGAVMFPAGMLIASTAQSPAPLYIGFGAMCGFAAGLCYNATVSTVSAWFPDRQGVTSGTLLAGFGLSSFIAGKLFAAFAPADGSRLWAAGLRVLAGLLLAVLAVGIAVMRTPKEGELVLHTDTADTVRKKPAREPACDIPTSAMLRTSSFCLFYIWVSLLTAAGLMLVSQASGIAGETAPALSGSTIATAVGMISILNAAGRVCTGIVFDRFGYRVTMLMIITSFGIAAVTLILALRTGIFPLLIIGFITGGFAYGGNASIIPPLVADFYGRTWYATNMSLVPTNALFTSFASVLAGRIYDRTHSYMGALFLLAGAVVLSLVIFLALRRPEERNKNRE